MIPYYYDPYDNKVMQSITYTEWLTRNGFGATNTLLCIQVAETLQAVGVIFPGSEAIPWKLLSAADAEEALTMPRLILIGHTTRGDGLKIQETYTTNMSTNGNSFSNWPAVSEFIGIVIT